MSDDAGVDVVAIDVGGTTIKGARCSRDGVLDEVVAPTPSDAAESVDSVRRMARELTGLQTAAVAVATPGTVAPDGTVGYAANLGWRDVPLRALLADDVGVPVTVEHDVVAAGVAEAAEQAAADLFLVVLGTGVAGVHVLDGVPARGASGAAGEIGHLVVRPDGEQCPCGSRGCLERYASGAGVARRHAQRGGDPRWDAARVAQAAATDRCAGEVWTEACAALATGLAAVTLVADPEVIVLGGGLAGAGEALLEPVQRALAEALPWRPAPPVALARLGADGGRRGAALLAWRLADREQVPA